MINRTMLKSIIEKGVKTLDLNRKFEEIAAQRDAIIVQWVEGVL